MSLFGLCGALLQAEEPSDSSHNHLTNPMAITSSTRARPLYCLPRGHVIKNVTFQLLFCLFLARGTSREVPPR